MSQARRRVRCLLAEVSTANGSQESNYIFEESNLKYLKEAFSEVSIFLLKETRVRDEALYGRVMEFKAIMQQRVCEVIKIILEASLKFMYQQMTANIFAEIIYRLLRLADSRRGTMLDVIKELEEKYAKKSKRTNHVIRQILEEGLLMSEEEFQRLELVQFGKQFYLFISKFTEEIIYAN